jgi:hypothetical protein
MAALAVGISAPIGAHPQAWHSSAHVYAVLPGQFSLYTAVHISNSFAIISPLFIDS